MNNSNTKSFLILVDELLVEIEQRVENPELTMTAYLPVLERLVELEKGMARVRLQKRMIEAQKALNDKN